MHQTEIGVAPLPRPKPKPMPPRPPWPPADPPRPVLRGDQRCNYRAPVSKDSISIGERFNGWLFNR